MFETGLDVHHDMILNIMMNVTNNEVDDVQDGNINLHDHTNVITLDEFFRNNLLILLFGYCFNFNCIHY